MDPTDQNQEVFSNTQRTSAVTAMRNRAHRLRYEAARWESLANALDEITKYASSQSKDGGEGGPHIGVGSAPEELLWELATRPLENGL
jgi:hypothetical protein